GVLDVAAFVELEQQEQRQVLVGQDAQLRAAGGVLHQLQQLLRAGRTCVRKTLGDLDLTLAADLHLRGSLGPLDGPELLLRFGQRRLGRGGLVRRRLRGRRLRGGRLLVTRLRGRRRPGGQQGNDTGDPENG